MDIQLFIRKNGSLLGIILGFCVLSGLSVFLLLNQINKSQQVASELDQLRHQRDSLWNQELELSPQNVKLVQSNTVLQATLVTNALQKLKESYVPSEEVDGFQLKPLIFARVKKMKILLQDENAINIPERFNFGFERYRDKTPDKNDTFVLRKQLEIVGELVQLLADAQIRELTSIRRVEFESQEKPKNNRNPDKEPLVSLQNEFTYVANPGPGYLYSIMPFELEFVTSAEAFQTFLNSLGQSKYVLLPRVISVTNQQKGKKVRPAPEKEPARTGDDEAPFERKREVKRERPSDPFELPVELGGELLSVKMKVDWLEFSPEAERMESSKDKDASKNVPKKS
jgi:hypothetical protein